MSAFPALALVPVKSQAGVGVRYASLTRREKRLWSRRKAQPVHMRDGVWRSQVRRARRIERDQLKADAEFDRIKDEGTLLERARAGRAWETALRRTRDKRLILRDWLRHWPIPLTPSDIEQFFSIEYDARFYEQSVRMLC